MAKPISFAPRPRDLHPSSEDILQEVVAKHADAIQAGCEVLQLLHDKGVLELVRGALGSGDKVLEIAVEAANKPQSIRSIRNLIQLVNLVGEIDPEILRAFTVAIPVALKSIGENSKPPGLFRMAKDLLGNQDTRRGISAMTTVIEALGRELAEKPPSGNAPD